VSNPTESTQLDFVENLPGIVRCGLSKQSKNKYFPAQTRLFPYVSPQTGRVAQANQKPFHKPAAPWTKGQLSLKRAPLFVTRPKHRSKRRFSERHAARKICHLEKAPLFADQPEHYSKQRFSTNDKNENLLSKTCAPPNAIFQPTWAG